MLELLLPCIFAAWVVNVSALGDSNIIRVRNDPGCEVSAVIEEGKLILTHKAERVEIPLPPDRQWHRMKYEFGRSVADVEVWSWVPVRKGPKDMQ